MLDRELEVTVGWLGRGVQAVAVPVIFPAVVEAAQPVFLDAAVVEARPAMAAVLGDQPRLARRVAKEHQILAQDAYRLCAERVFRQLGGRRDRLPVTAHQLAHGGARSDLGQACILFSGQQDTASTALFS